MRELLRTFWRLLTPAQRRRWLMLAPLLCLAGAIETAATGLVFLLIKIAGDPDYVHKVRPLAAVCSWLPWSSPRAIILAYGVFLIVFFVVRSAVLIFITHAEAGATAETTAALSTRMLSAYLSSPFAPHLRKSASDLAYGATTAVERVVSSGMNGAVQVLAELLVSVGLATFLVIAAPLTTLVTAGVLGILVAIALRLTKRTSAHWGERREELGRRAEKDLLQSLGGIREIKILGRERFFLDSFTGAQFDLARTRRVHNTIATMPRIAIETIFVCCVVLVVGLVTARGEPSEDVVALLGIYAYAGFRFIPSANRLMMYVDAMRGSAAAARQVTDELAVFERPAAAVADPAPAMSFAEAIVLDRVSYTYEGTTQAVLSDISLTIRHGESIGVVGATGAGKSTLIDLILGLLDPTTGHILVDGKDVAADEPTRRAWQRRIGYVSQASFLFDETIRMNVALGLRGDEIDDGRLREAIAMAQLADFVATLPEGLDTVIGDRGVRLSGGQRQRIAIARALYHQPELLVFDEATSALDNQTERELTRAVEGLRGKKTLIIIAHRLSTVRRCDALVFLAGGRVEAIGPFDALLETSAAFRAMAAMEPPLRSE